MTHGWTLSPLEVYLRAVVLSPLETLEIVLLLELQGGWAKD